MAKHPEVQARLEEIREGTEKNRGAAGSGLPVGTRAIAAKVNVTAESLIADAQKLFDKGYETGQLSAACSALKEKGILSGKRIERSEVGTPGDFDHLSDEELEHALHERLVRLGYIPDTGTQH